MLGGEPIIKNQSIKIQRNIVKKLQSIKLMCLIKKTKTILFINIILSKKLNNQTLMYKILRLNKRMYPVNHIQL